MSRNGIYKNYFYKTNLSRNALSSTFKAVILFLDSDNEEQFAKVLSQLYDKRNG